MKTKRWPKFDWSKERVLLTGGAGFLGRYVHKKLLERGADPKKITIPRSKTCDLRDPRNIKRLMKRTKPTMVIHLAAVVGGIGANRKNPGKFFYDNAVMGIHMIEEARLAKVKKFVQVGTICAYPKFTKVPFREEDLWNGYPEETNAPYGLAKKMLLVQLQAYRQQYGFNGIYLLPVNLYGPGDNFDLESSHVIPAIISKVHTAISRRQAFVKLWGSGRPTREFLFVSDAAEGVVLAAERYNGSAPVNLGTGGEISIARLARMVAVEMRYSGRVVWNRTMPDGQMRRRLSTSRARASFSYTAKTVLRDGLRATISSHKIASSKDV